MVDGGGLENRCPACRDRGFESLPLRQEGPFGRVMGQGSGVTVKPVENLAGYRQLRAWQKADDLACSLFALMETWPAHRRWLTSQVIRAAVSVPANIAEGYSRGSLREYLHHLSIARGSLAETEYYLHFMHRNGIVGLEACEPLSSLHREASSLLYALIRSLSKKLEEDGGRRPYAISEDGVGYDLDPWPTDP